MLSLKNPSYFLIKEKSSEHTSLQDFGIFGVAYGEKFT
jgi:hypothetical protein